MSKLTVYRASAGSGKTFRLTIEYIKLLFEDIQNYRYVLGVTFTNKATGEMKSRILEVLYLLSTGKPTPYKEILMQETGIDEPVIKHKAFMAMEAILHDYSRFHIQTIDSFFNGILSGFARESGLQLFQNIELDQNRVLTEAIEQLIFRLNEGDNLTNWLTRFAEEKISQGKSWNVSSDLGQLGKEIFREHIQTLDQEFENKLNDKEFIRDFISGCKKIISHFEITLFEMGNKGLEVMDSYNLSPTDFKNGMNGVGGFICKLANKKVVKPKGRTLNALESEEEWSTQKSPKALIIKDAVHSGLQDILREIVNFYNQTAPVYYSSILVQRHLHALAIVTDIRENVIRLNKEKGQFLLQDVTRLLNMLVRDNDAPFIYEKAGNHFNHFMLDEFQDTSELQWQNFKPLLENSLSQGNRCLVVGDVKQSIYRWRNSNWNILAESLPREYKMFFNEEFLNYNRRSTREIIYFNNSFFESALQILTCKYIQKISENDNENTGIAFSNRMNNAYRNLKQTVPAQSEKTGGYVEMRVSCNKDDAAEYTYQTIKKLRTMGYIYKDMAILVRKKDEGVHIARYILQKNRETHGKTEPVRVISNEALFIRYSPAVRLLTCLMKYISLPRDKINQQQVITEYTAYLKENEMRVLQEIPEYPEEILPQEFFAELTMLQKLSIYELTEKLIWIFGLNQLKEELPYLQTFQDQVVQQTGKSTADIFQFLDWWEEHKNDISLPLSGQQDAVRILTIHKAKGLEFKNVILPFTGWNLDNTNNFNVNFLWCTSGVAPFNKLPVIPVNYSSGLSETVFASEYYEEKFNNLIDNLNLMYVAFTRAEKNIFVNAQANEKEEIKTAGDIVRECGRELAEKQLIQIEKHEDREIFRMGKINPAETLPKPGYDSSLIRQNKYPVTTRSDRLGLKTHALKYYMTSTEPDFIKKINHGLMMHELFAGITSFEDIPRAIEKIKMSGKLTGEEEGAFVIELEKLFQKNEVKEWFDPGWKVKTEPAIILKNAKVRRPDRVITRGNQAKIIDFKFGNARNNKHTKQVREYIGYMKEMGFTEVTGYLWYVTLDDIVKIEPHE
ncbi:MAG: UvrD-helicase domain-containing protein [Bacteroidales bacterium]